MKELRDKTWRQIGNDRLAVVKVSTSWCGPCKMLRPHFNKWANQWGVYNDVKIKYYNVDGDKCPQFKQEHRVDRYPTTLFFVYGVQVFKLYGLTRSSVFEELIKKSLDVQFERNSHDDDTAPNNETD